MSESPEALTRRIVDSFARQTYMQTIGARLGKVAPGEVEIEAPFAPKLTQQDGFLHAGALATIADSACGYAALTMMPPSSRVLSIEFKINMLSPAVGERFVARGRVVRAGKTIHVTTADVIAVSGAGEKVVAVMQATMMRVEASP